MQKILISILIPLLLCHLSSITKGAATNHRDELKKKFPYGLLTDDYGILTLNDLALNSCHSKPEPFVPGRLSPYEYWLCFESKNILAACEDQNFSNEDGYVGRLVVQAQDQQFKYRFIESRPWPITDCGNFAKTLKKLVQGTSHACISASYMDEEKKELGKKERIGIFNRLKSRKGCEGTECNFTETIKKEFCPDLNF
jgi:hypothetical protein